MSLFTQYRVLLKGGGDLGTGAAWRLHKTGFEVVITELAAPLVVRRSVAFGNAVYEGQMTVEGLTAVRAGTPDEARRILDRGDIPVLVDPAAQVRFSLAPAVIVDAVMAKRNTGTRITDAPLVVGLGPGFTPGVDCHAVVETMRGHHLGRVLWDRPAEPNTATPGEIGGRAGERVLRAPQAGVIYAVRQIGDHVRAGDVIARVKDLQHGSDGADVTAPFDGILRGLVREGLPVEAGMKIGDIDPRADREACFTISDKALAIGGGVLEAVLSWINRPRR